MCLMPLAWNVPDELALLPSPSTIVVFLSSYVGRMLNVHPSLLPKHRGLNTYARVLDAGDDWHGSTVHFVVPELDAGPSIIQYRVRVGPADDVASLQQRVQQGEYEIYPRAIDWLATGRLQLRSGEAWLDGQALIGAPGRENGVPPRSL